MMNDKFKIEPKETLWKQRTYKVVEKGKNFEIERPYECQHFNLEDAIQKLLRRKHKWE